ncbi:ANTAR domain-containing protein [Mycolicibacterium sp. CAU 1645]|uniref:ANTAR domain-containing protein n=2 Tax=Mycolicibacterium arenosum TaxID=2952157 RepID=A0ABT1MD61_9MYCO|nr:ANTAR domain-containing protein [Mycolicibacterium sp. CAU 1645]
MLMFVCDISADQAFAILRTVSQDRTIKLTLIAEQISKDLPELARSNRFERRMHIDGILSNAHRRVVDATARLLNEESNNF